MLEMGKDNQKYENIIWQLAPAEKLPFKDDTFDFYS